MCGGFTSWSCLTTNGSRGALITLVLPSDDSELPGSCWLLGIDGEGRGSGVEVVEWSVEWRKWCCDGWREIRF
nr:hypothetical protein [Tanacetum cinerariifolium]